MLLTAQLDPCNISVKFFSIFCSRDRDPHQSMVKDNNCEQFGFIGHYSMLLFYFCFACCIRRRAPKQHKMLSSSIRSISSCFACALLILWGFPPTLGFIHLSLSLYCSTNSPSDPNLGPHGHPSPYVEGLSVLCHSAPLNT